MPHGEPFGCKMAQKIKSKKKKISETQNYKAKLLLEDKLWYVPNVLLVILKKV